MVLPAPIPVGLRQIPNRFCVRCFVIAAALVFFVALVAEVRAENVRVRYSASQNLKNFALSTCVAGGARHLWSQQPSRF
jgi:hypothetical protein